MKDKILEAIGAAFLVALTIATFILFLFATPDQMSAECDALTVEMKN